MLAWGAGVLTLGAILHRDFLFPRRAWYSIFRPHEQLPPVLVDPNHSECLQVSKVRPVLFSLNGRVMLLQQSLGVNVSFCAAPHGCSNIPGRGEGVWQMPGLQALKQTNGHKECHTS